MVVYHDFNDHAEGNPLDANFQKREEIWKKNQEKIVNILGKFPQGEIFISGYF